MCYIGVWIRRGATGACEYLLPSSSIGCFKAVMSLNVHRKRTTCSFSFLIGAMCNRSHSGVPEKIKKGWHRPLTWALVVSLKRSKKDDIEPCKNKNIIPRIDWSRSVLYLLYYDICRCHWKPFAWCTTRRIAIDKVKIVLNQIGVRVYRRETLLHAFVFLFKMSNIHENLVRNSVNLLKGRCII